MKDKPRFIAPDCRTHREAMFDLIARVFSQNGYFVFRDRCRNQYVDHSHYDWQASRIGLVGEQVVTHYGVWDYRMRIGTARVRVGGIGAVATHGDFRKRGLMAGTTRAAIQAMSEQGYDMTILFGIPNFYNRFGYVRAWPATVWFVSADALPEARAAVRLRRFRPGHRADMAAMYNRQSTRLTGTAVRPTYLRAREGRQGRRWTDARGRTRGYVVTCVRGARLECVDFGGAPADVLAALGKIARKAGHREIVLSGLHYESPLCARLRRGSCRVETSYFGSGGAMIRTICLRSTLEKMCGELTRRLRASHLAGWRGKLLIADKREKVTLAIGRAGVGVARPQPSRHAIRGGEEIARLLIGADDPAQIVAAAGMRLAGEARGLVGVLFPDQHPMLAGEDYF